MRKVIEGRVYDTDTAEYVCDVSNGSHDGGNFRFDDTDLYRTKKGAFFIQGRSGALGRWAVQLDNGSAGGSGMRLLDAPEARSLVEQYGTPELWSRLFGEPEEG